MTIFEEVVKGAKEAWHQVDKSTIVPEWWEAFLGAVPEDVEELEDAQVMCLAFLNLQDQVIKAGVEL